jgi:circadian clock protein KaiC
VSLLIIPPARLDVDILATEIRGRVEGLGIKRAVIDSMAVVEQEIPFPKRAPRYVSSLLDYLREHGVTTILTQESGAFDGGRISDALAAVLSDNLVILQWVEYEGRIYRILSVRKMRQSAFDPGLREFRIADGVVRVLPLDESGIETMGGIAMQERREARIARRNRPE